MMQEVPALEERLQKLNTLQDQTCHLNIELQAENERLRGKEKELMDNGIALAYEIVQKDTTIATLEGRIKELETLLGEGKQA